MNIKQLKNFLSALPEEFDNASLILEGVCIIKSGFNYE